MWDPSEDIDAVMEEYYANFFGPAAAPVQPTYPPYKLWTIRKNFKHDRFYDPAARPQITQLLQQLNR